MIWSAQTIISRRNDFNHRTWQKLEISPFHSKEISNGMSFGLTAAGYDIRLGCPDYLDPVKHTDMAIFDGGFELAHSLEYLKIPEDCQAIVHDKSSWARKGLSLFNTVLEPGWKGYITLELANHSKQILRIPFGAPIAQIVFHQLDSRTSLPYTGKYQNQPNHPVGPIKE